jgi:diacylglycerol kinase
MLKKHTLSLSHAFEGLKWVVQTQANFKIHIFFSVLSLFGAWFLRISYIELLIILTLISIGLVIETINTGIEETIDAIHKDWSPEIKIAKDVAAASMLIFAISSATIASIIFVPKILILVGF